MTEEFQRELTNKTKSLHRYIVINDFLIKANTSTLILYGSFVSNKINCTIRPTPKQQIIKEITPCLACVTKNRSVKKPNSIFPLRKKLLKTCQTIIYWSCN